MTGVLYAKVAGQWVPVQMPVPVTDEVWVGPDDPGVGSGYEIWYDTDDDGPQYGNYAQGVTNLGGFYIANGTAMPTSGNTAVAGVTNFYYVSGRRYRLLMELNAGTSAGAAGTTSNGYFTLYVDGVAQAGGVWLTYPGGLHQHMSYEWYLEKYGMSAGLHRIDIYFTHSAGAQITLHTDNAQIEIRDVGPTNPMNPTTQTTPAPWTSLPYATGWQHYDVNSFNPGGYRKLGDVVYLRGLITQVAGATSTVFTLPTGFRPARQVIQSILTSTGQARFDITTGGVFTTSTAISAGNWVCLDSIDFSVTPG